MPTPGIDFVLNNLQTTLTGNNAVVPIPVVQGLERQSALTMSSRQPGQANYRQNSAAGAGGVILLDGMETLTSTLGYAKNAGIQFTLNSTANSTINLTALTNNASTIGANAASLATDSSFTSFNAYNQVIIYNLSGVTDNGSQTLTVNVGATNGATLPVAANNAYTLQPASRWVIEATGNGITVNATKNTITIAGNGQNVGITVSGS